MNIPRHLLSLPLLVIPPLSAIAFVPDALRVVLGVGVLLSAALGVAGAYYHREPEDHKALRDALNSLDNALKQDDAKGADATALALLHVQGSVGSDIRKQLVYLTLWVAVNVVAYVTSLYYLGAWAYATI